MSYSHEDSLDYPRKNYYDKIVIIVLLLVIVALMYGMSSSISDYNAVVCRNCVTAYLDNMTKVRMIP